MCLLNQMPEHEEKTAAVIVVAGFDWRLDAHSQRDLFGLAIGAVNDQPYVLARAHPSFDADEIESLRPVQFETLYAYALLPGGGIEYLECVKG
jgi:hypothetical protein